MSDTSKPTKDGRNNGNNNGNDNGNDNGKNNANGGKGKPRANKPRAKPPHRQEPAATTDVADNREMEMKPVAAPLSARKISVGRKESMLTCILCCHVIDNVDRFNTVGVCGHTGCCSLCSLRMRQLMGTSACTICKSDLPRVICIERESQSFDSFQDWGDNIGPSHIYDDVSGIFFLKHDMPRIRKLRDPVCRKCDKKFATAAALKTHVQDVHQLQYCGICLEHKKLFLGEQELLTKEQLKTHSNKGNPREGFSGHPRCDFCFSRFYSNTELFDHLHKNHFECDICLHSLGVQNRYYKDYTDMENHFRADHFLCEEPHCLSKKFVVFKSHLDLQAHTAQEHPHIKISRKIDVHFTVRRATPGANNDGYEDFEQFARQGAAGAGDFNGGPGNVINVADFPSLAGATTTGQGVFWENQTVSRPRMDDFPSLPTAPAQIGGRFSAGRGGGGAAAFRNALAPPPTPAMLAHMNNSDSWEYPELERAAEALGANNPLMRFVKPAKGKMKNRGKSPTSKTAAAAAAARAQAEDDGEEEKAAALVAMEDELKEEEETTTTPSLSKSALVLKIRQTLGSDAKYEVFREACKQFRLEEVDVATFYTKIRSMFHSVDDFEKLFLKLMKLSPDRTQVNQVITYHKQHTKQGPAVTTKTKNKQQQNQQHQQQNQLQQQAKNKPGRPKTPTQQQQQKAAAAGSGWANALRQSGVSASAAPVVIRAPQLPSRPEVRSVWTPSQGPTGPVAHVSSTEMPTSTKIMSAPLESFAALAVSSYHGGTSASSSSYAQSTTTRAVPPQPTNFHNAKSDFPSLPKAGKPIGVQAVTRATWDDQVQSIAHNRPVAAAATTGGKNKKQNKKKTLSLGELAMQFS